MQKYWVAKKFKLLNKYITNEINTKSSASLEIQSVSVEMNANAVHGAQSNL